MISSVVNQLSIHCLVNLADRPRQNHNSIGRSVGKVYCGLEVVFHMDYCLQCFYVHSVLFNLGENFVDAEQKTHSREYG